MRRAIFYGWVIAAVTAVVLVATGGVRSAPGAFLLSMQTEPGWSTGALSFAAAVGLLAYGLSGPISGRLMVHLGIREAALLSLLITAGSLLISGLSREIWQVTVFAAGWIAIIAGFAALGIRRQCPAAPAASAAARAGA